jgi:hypothetical protein
MSTPAIGEIVAFTPARKGKGAQPKRQTRRVTEER